MNARKKEILSYLIFGVATTAVGWAVYFAVILAGRSALSLPTEDTSSATYLGLYTAAQIIQWVAAVLFAFFTNKKWVFTEADKGSTGKQLAVFAGGRVLTLALDYAVTLLGALALSALLPSLSRAVVLGRELNLNEIAAKIAAAVLVIVGNYIFSKLLVFKKKV